MPHSPTLTGKEEWLIAANAIAISQLLVFIEDNLDRPLSVTLIAERAGYSPFHLNRMFAVVMGTSLMDYVLQRRLEQAAAALSAGERVLDIATRLGFESHGGFTRAFKRRTGLTPSQFRSLPPAAQILFPRYTLPILTQGGTSMQATIVNRPEKLVVGYRLHTTPASAQIPSFWNEIMQDGRWQELLARAAENGENYGLCIHPENMPQGQMDYMIAFDYDGHTPLGQDMELYTVPAAAYAVFKVSTKGDDFVHGIRATWQKIYAEWFPSSGYNYDGDKPDFELYHCDDTCSICLPVTR